MTTVLLGSKVGDKWQNIPFHDPNHCISYVARDQNHNPLFGSQTLLLSELSSTISTLGTCTMTSWMIEHLMSDASTNARKHVTSNFAFASEQ